MYLADERDLRRPAAQPAVKQEAPPGAFWWPSTPPLPALTVARPLDPADPPHP
jgi:hypothetical protein